ncbi:MAG: DUF459 domain-containing protein [Deltaproteobacteria bacterium]|nr:DUF459 domain-containing protein [Deltaproteobacteria bacterium]
MSLLALLASVATATAPLALMVGDSMAMTDLGEAIEREVAHDGRVRFARFGKSGTGLTRPDLYDWTEKLPNELAAKRPHYLMVALGGNDGQALHFRGRARRAIPWGDSAWLDEYRGRVDAFLALVPAETRRVIWLEIPRRAPEKLEARAAVIRELVREVAGRHARVSFLETGDIFGPRESGVAGVQVEGFRGCHPLHQPDGVHFSAAGAAFVASRLTPGLFELFGLAGTVTRAGAPCPRPQNPT